MSFAKELLFSCVVMMHVSFVVLRPLDKQSLCKSLEDFGLPLGNLRMAERNYVELILGGDQPSKYESDTWMFSEGITFENTTEKIKASVCAIMDYLGNHLPNITRNLTEQFDPIIANATRFLHHFKAAVKPSKVTGCKIRKIKTSHGYTRKVTGLRIMYSSRRWVMHFKKDC